MRTLQFSQRRKGRSEYILKLNKVFLVFPKTEGIIFFSVDNISLRLFQDQSLILIHRVRWCYSIIYNASHEKQDLWEASGCGTPGQGAGGSMFRPFPHMTQHLSNLTHTLFLQPASLFIKAVGSHWTYWLRADTASQTRGVKRRAGCHWQAAWRVGNLGVLWSLRLKHHHYSMQCLVVNLTPGNTKLSHVKYGWWITADSESPSQLQGSPSVNRIFLTCSLQEWDKKRTRLEALTQPKKASSSCLPSHSLHLCLALLLPSLLQLQSLGGVTLHPSFLAIPFSIAFPAYRHRCGRQRKQDDPQLHCHQGRE